MPDSKTRPTLDGVLQDIRIKQFMEENDAYELTNIGDVEGLVALLDNESIPYNLEVHGPIASINTRHNHDLTYSVRPKVFLAKHKYNATLYDAVCNAPDDEVSPEDIGTVVWSHDRPLRFWMLKELLEIKYEMVEAIKLGRDTHAFSNLIMGVYTDTEIFDMDFANEWAELLTEHRDKLRHTTLPMQTKSREYSDNDQITLYHGVEFDYYFEPTAEYKARAWTTSMKTAKFFANRFKSNKHGTRPVLKTTMTYKEINERATFYTDGRSESEVYFDQGIENFEIIK